MRRLCMKRKLVYLLAALRLIAIILVGFVSSSSSQAPTSVFVKHIVINAEYDPRFVWSMANSAIPWNGLTSPTDIECLKNELRETRLFSKIETRLNKPTDSETYELVVSLSYKLSSPRYEVGAIDVTNLQGVDVIRLQQLIINGGFCWKHTFPPNI